MFGDYFQEIDPEGKTVWEWHGIEHFDPDIDIIGAIHPREEWTHINDVVVMPNGNIVSNSRHLDNAMYRYFSRVVEVAIESKEQERHKVRQTLKFKKVKGGGNFQATGAIIFGIKVGDYFIEN